MGPDSEIQFEYHAIRIYKSGRIERLFSANTIPASTDPETGVTSKDVIIDPNINLAARLYLPNLTDQTKKKLPIYVYYHGGAYMVGSAFETTEHSYLNHLVSEANILAVSVDYRLAPEHPIPVPYNDSWAAFKWVISHVNGGSEPWLVKHGDFGRLFIAGCSSGGNIAHYMAVRSGTTALEPGVVIRGLVLIHPFFASKEAVESERMDQNFRPMLEESWKFIYPGATWLDDPLFNPFVEGELNVKKLACERVLVSVTEADWLGVWYYQRLKESGWDGEVEFHESEGEAHAFHLFKPTCEKAIDLKLRTAAFLNE